MSAGPHAPDMGVRRWIDLMSSDSKHVLFVVVLGTTFLAAHLPYIAPGPGSIDATNFALAVQDFDITDHRPHPPGYPVFVALGKITVALISTRPQDPDNVRHEARALALWSVLFGAFAVVPLFQIFRCLDLGGRRAAAATALTVTCPIFWFMAIRPMSDMPGLGAALVTQALAFTAYRRHQLGEQVAAQRLLAASAAAAGLALGLRSQTIWLTLPILLMFAGAHLRANRARRRSAAMLVGAFAIGVAAWAIPLFAASGGPGAYLSVLATQGREDLAEVELLATRPTIARLVIGLVSTFAHPWANRYLAPLVLALAAIGAAAMLMRSRQALGLLALASGPYVVFHLLYQDPVFTRYAMPVVPAVACLAVCGADALSSRWLWRVVGGLTVAGLVVAARPVFVYAAAGGPGYQAMTAVRAALPSQTVQPVIAAHHEVGLAIRGEQLPAQQLAFPRRREWLEVVKYWRSSGSAPVWFFAESRRTDLHLIDPAARRLRGTFRFPFDNRFLMSGALPSGVDWYELSNPGWFVGEGWALTPETAGVASRDDRGPARRPIAAWIRRRPESAFMMIGGRHLGACGQPDERFEARLDGRLLDTWVVGPSPGFFLRAIALPAGSLVGSGPYSELSIAATAADGVIRSVDAAIEQFDVQSDRPVHGFDQGWYQPEYDSAERRLFRWAGPWATLRIHRQGRDVTLRLTGDSPLKHAGAVPVVTVRVGSTILGQFTPSSAFTYEVQVPAASLDAAEGVVTLEADRSFVPDETMHNGDRRLLGVRIYDVGVF